MDRDVDGRSGRGVPNPQMKLPPPFNALGRTRWGLPHTVRPEFPPTKFTKGKYELSADIAFWHWPGEWIRSEYKLGRELGPQRLSIVDRSVDGRMERRVESKSKTHTRGFQSHDVTHPISTERGAREGRREGGRELRHPDRA